MTAPAASYKLVLGTNTLGSRRVSVTAAKLATFTTWRDSSVPLFYPASTTLNERCAGAIRA